MARKRKSHRTGVEKMKPVEGAIVVIASYDPDGKGLFRHIEERFLDPRQANHHINQLLNGDEYTIERRISDDDQVVTTDERLKIYVAGDRLGEVFDPMAYNAFSYPPRNSIHYLLKGPRAYVFQKASASDQGDDVVSEGKQRTRRAKSSRPSRSQSKGKVVASVKGLISANAIAERLEVPGSTVRAVIRGMKLEKVNGGWWFDEDTARRIRKKVKAKLA